MRARLPRSMPQGPLRTPPQLRGGTTRSLQETCHCLFHNRPHRNRLRRCHRNSLRRCSRTCLLCRTHRSCQSSIPRLQLQGRSTLRVRRLQMRSFDLTAGEAASLRPQCLRPEPKDAREAQRWKLHTRLRRPQRAARPRGRAAARALRAYPRLRAECPERTRVPPRPCSPQQTPPAGAARMRCPLRRRLESHPSRAQPRGAHGLLKHGRGQSRAARLLEGQRNRRRP